MDMEENEERVLQCPLNICERKFFNNHGAAQHAVDSHRFNIIVFRPAKYRKSRRSRKSIEHNWQGQDWFWVVLFIFFYFTVK